MIFNLAQCIIVTEMLNYILNKFKLFGDMLHLILLQILCLDISDELEKGTFRSRAG